MTTATTGAERPLEVLMLPDYRLDNPYQTLLVEALSKQGARVQFPQGYRRGLPIFRASRTGVSSYDILHLHWIAPYARGRDLLTKTAYSLKFLTDSMLTRGSGVRIAFTIHNLVGHDAAFANIDLWVRRSLMRWVDCAIVHDRAALELASDRYHFNPSKATVIPHGHYRKAYGQAIAKDLARQKLGLPPKGKLYLNLGMLRPYKGIEALLQAWSTSQLPTAGHTLLIAGKALDSDYGSAIAARVNATPHAILHSHFIADADIPLYFSAADIVVLPFQTILTSGSLILAMSYGKAAIAPRLGGIVETLAGADDLLYDPHDERGLVDTLNRSLNVELSDLNMRIERACDRLDWDAIGQRTVAVYRSALGRSP
ncbi:MAG: glycosyltransferase [Cyanobacteria bacterium P01_F01_bin.33]